MPYSIDSSSDRCYPGTSCLMCTGGLIGKLLTDVPGSSEVYMGGVISYTNGVKHRLLGVSEDTLRVYTAVSRQTAHEMARGAREAE